MNTNPNWNTNPNCLNRFRNYIIEHQRFRQVLDEICTFISWVPEAALIFVIGPPGAGKSRLRLHLAERLRAMGGNRQDAVISLEAMADERASSTAAFPALYKDSLRQSRMPIFGGIGSDMGASASGYGQPTRASSREMLRAAFEESLRVRRPLGVIVDEAHHLLQASGGALIPQINALKSISDRSRLDETSDPVRFILIGPYHLVRCASPTGTLARRGHVVHFSPYRRGYHDPRDAADEDDERHFLDVIATMESLLPFEKPSHLAEHADLLMDRSVGCVGILHDWLLKAAVTAIIRGADRITRAHLLASCLNEVQLAQIYTEVSEGLRLFESPPKFEEQVEFSFAEEASTPGADGARRRRRPGEPNPKRLPIGHDGASVQRPNETDAGEDPVSPETAAGEPAPEPGQQTKPPKRRSRRKPKTTEPDHEEPKDE